MKLVLLLAALLITCHLSLFTFVRSTSAHVLKTDGSIGAVLHIDPEDDPIAGETSNFFFELKDREGKFTPENCDCKLSVLENGKEIYNSQTDVAGEGVSASFVFPRKNIYQIKLFGNPKRIGAFQPFTLSYDIRIERISEIPLTSPVTQTNYSSFFYALLIIIIIVGIYLLFKQQRR